MNNINNEELVNISGGCWFLVNRFISAIRNIKYLLRLF